MKTGFCFLRRHTRKSESIHHQRRCDARRAAPIIVKQFRLAAIVREINALGRPVAKPACIVCGGETTVTIRGKGKGGRDQEIPLAAAIENAGMQNVVVLSGGTDGTDDPTDAAGAIADGETMARAAAKEMDARAYLANNDAYNFFQPLHDLLMTGTNVNDVTVVLVG